MASPACPLAALLFYFASFQRFHFVSPELLTAVSPARSQYHYHSTGAFKMRKALVNFHEDVNAADCFRQCHQIIFHYVSQ